MITQEIIRRIKNKQINKLNFDAVKLPWRKEWVKQSLVYF